MKIETNETKLIATYMQAIELGMKIKQRNEYEAEHDEKYGIINLDMSKYISVIHELVDYDNDLLHEPGYLNKTIVVFPNEETLRNFYNLKIECSHDHNIYDDNDNVIGETFCLTTKMSLKSTEYSLLSSPCPFLLKCTAKNLKDLTSYFEKFNTPVKRVIVMDSNWTAGLTKLPKAKFTWFDSCDRKYKSPLLRKLTKDIPDYVILNQLNQELLLKMETPEEYFGIEVITPAVKFGECKTPEKLQKILKNLDVSEVRQQNVIEEYKNVLADKETCKICYNNIGSKNNNYMLFLCCQNFSCLSCFTKVCRKQYGMTKCPFCNIESKIDSNLLFVNNDASISMYISKVINSLISMRSGLLIMSNIPLQKAYNDPILTSCIGGVRDTTDHKYYTTFENEYIDTGAKTLYNMVFITDGSSYDTQKLAYIVKKHKTIGMKLIIDISKIH